MSSPSPIPLPPDKNQGPAILGVAWSTLGLALIVVTARIYARLKSRSFGFDDANIIVAVLISVFGAVCNILQVRAGFGRHAVYLTKDQLQVIEHWSLGAQLQGPVSIGFTKVSVCWFIHRLLKRTNRWMHIVIWVDMAIFSSVTVAYAMTQILACIPLQAYWNPKVHGSCLSRHTLSQIALMMNVVDVVTDFVCAALPLAVLRGLQMNRQTKIALGLLIGFGFITAATSIGKAATVKFTISDPSWDFVSESIWTILEENVSIVVASLPALRMLFTMFQRESQVRRSRSHTARSIWQGSTSTTTTGEAFKSDQRYNSCFGEEDTAELVSVPDAAIVRRVDVMVEVGPGDPGR